MAITSKLKASSQIKNNVFTTIIEIINLYYRRMLIDREHYLQLLKKIEILAEQNLLLTRQNQILSHELEDQKCLNYELINRFKSMEQKTVLLNDKIINQNDCLHHDLKGHTTVLSQKQREYLEEKFKELETSSFQKYKLLEIRNTANRIENHELLQFCEKIKRLYKRAKKAQKQPSFKDMLKWVKQTKLKKQAQCQQPVKKQSQTKSSWKSPAAK